MSNVSPGRCRATDVRLILMESALMRQRASEVVVSTAAVSLRAMSRSASARRAPFTSTASWSKSIPLERSHNSPTWPFTRRSLMKPLVFSFACVTDSSSMTMRLLNSGRSWTSTERWPRSANVSPSWIIIKSSMPRSKGHSSLMVPTLISIPVFSDAIAATLSATQFCTGGRYSSAASMRNNRMGVNTAMNNHFATFFIDLQG